MTKGIIYYTGNNIGDPIFSLVQEYILKANLPIVSVSLKPIDFGQNIVLENRKRSYPTMIKQILTALEASTEDYVFFCEHDVLYHPTHFDFIPPKDNIFYYNTNVWRWRMKDQLAITYYRMNPLSCLCVNRKFAVDHYRMRSKKMKELGESEFRSREPRMARIWGYEPGTKKKRRGGFSDDDYDTWHSEYPTIDIRHKRTFSRPKVLLEEFKHQPIDWQEVSVDKIPGWNLKELFNL